MHVPDKWKITDSTHIIAIINKVGFATLVTPDLNASELPLIYDQEKHRLLGHFARTNTQHKVVEESKAVAIFNGPHHYISPTWYEHKPAVPTWNYVSVHVHGHLSFLDDEQTLASINKLVNKYEPELLTRKDVMSSQYQQKLLKGIVGFELVIDNIDAKAKLGQHRRQADQEGVFHHLSQLNTPDSNALIEAIKQLNLAPQATE